MSDSGEDWHLEISSGVTKTAQWRPQAYASESNSNTNSQNSGFTAPEKRFGRGRGRARSPTDNWRTTNGSTSSVTWRSSGNNEDSDNTWARKPRGLRGGFNSEFSARDERPARSEGFGSWDRENGVSGGSRGDGGALRIEVSSRDVGKIIGKLNPTHGFCGWNFETKL